METNDKIPEGNPFKVPENYFGELNKRIISATSGAKEVAGRRGIYVRIRPYIAAAASVAILAIMSYTGLKLISPRHDIVSLSTISLEEDTELILNDIDILTLEENVNIQVSTFNGNPKTGNEIIDYLMDENIDISEIQDQL